MDAGPITFALPRPGRTLKRVLLFVLAVGLAVSAAVNFAHLPVLQWLAVSPAAVMKGQVWRLFTAGVLTDPDHFSHLFWTLVGFYFLSPDLEARWGGARFLRFLVWSNLAGFGLAVVLDRVLPASARVFHQSLMFGAMPALTAIAVAWSRLHKDAVVRLFMVVPVKGKTFFWITLGFCVVALARGDMLYEGAVAPFGGVLAGLLLVGEPSPARAAYLKLRLAFLRRRAGGPVSARDIVEGRAAPPSRRSRGDRPPLRVVPGGLEDELRKRKPPKDKRYLN